MAAFHATTSAMLPVRRSLAPGGEGQQQHRAGAAPPVGATGGATRTGANNHHRHCSLGGHRGRAMAVGPLRALSPQQEEMYLTLGVAPGASPEAVKRAYKRMAKLYHPDVCPDADAAARFNACKRAYEAIVAERTGNLSSVQTDEWRGKWLEQLKTMRKVESGQSTVNVRRRRVVKPSGAAAAAAAGGSDDAAAATAAAGAEAGEEEEEEEEEESDGSGGPRVMMDNEEMTWQRQQEMQWTVASQLSNLRDRTRRRRRVEPPQKGKFKEPFEDINSSFTGGTSATAHDDEWNHTVQ
eukprot:CAMPEP_0197613594 /NCGR_PEP_ID=MMETSP1326-20131121/59098_1 /TAXON_ID=1155430 /ORGANISM="Genus nov. species nov., Strain RCC2288" /LENGTH=295 /DNA_ID=CAMNT_0043182457 /DNA_START=68 /DNA_END=955 /DNA_ORIENTATION=+